MIHSRRFHQRPPSYYGQSVLEYDDPISFHKFNQEDPAKIYADWFADSDRDLADFKEKGTFREDEDKQEL